VFKQLVRFGLVGLLGSVVNLLVFAGVVRGFGGHPNLGAAVAFMIAATQNFTLNRLWTFQAQGTPRVNYAGGWSRYLVINLVGFAINLLVLNTVIALTSAAHSLPAQALGILCGMAFNFLLSRRLVFWRARQARRASWPC
jgi:putative flippase GtrA